MIARLRDWLLERRIASLSADIDRTYRHGDFLCNDFHAYGRVAYMDEQLAHLKRKRSEAQLARMKGRGE